MDSGTNTVTVDCDIRSYNSVDYEVRYVIIGNGQDRPPSETGEIVINDWHFFPDGTIQHRDSERVSAPALVSMTQHEIYKYIAKPQWVVISTHNGEAAYCSRPMSYYDAMAEAHLNPKNFPDESNQEPRDGLAVHVCCMGSSR